MMQTICRSYAELVSIVPQWTALANRSLPNIFYEPALFLPAFEYLREDSSPFVVLLWDNESPQNLIGFFPLVERSQYQRIPLRHIANWKYAHAFYCAPLIDKGREKHCFRQLLEALQKEFPRIHSYAFELQDQDTEFFEQLRSAEAFSSHSESYERAQLDIRNCDPATIMKKSHRKDLNRRQRKLAEIGELTYHVDEGSRDVMAWIAEFSALEQAGWKGHDGTAMNCDERDRAFFTEALRNSADAGKLKVTSSRIDGKLIASTCDLLSGDRSFAFKITYDETHRRLSPGILLVLKHIESLKNDMQLAWADSCAQEDSEMANRVYPERRTMSRIVMSKKSTPSGLFTQYLLGPAIATKKRLGQLTKRDGRPTTK